MRAWRIEPLRHAAGLQGAFQAGEPIRINWAFVNRARSVKRSGASMTGEIQGHSLKYDQRGAKGKSISIRIGTGNNNTKSVSGL